MIITHNVTLKSAVKSFTTIILFTVFAIIGIALIPLQSVKLNPSTTLPSISVRYHWGQASAGIMEKQATAPLEAALGMLPGVTEISSTSSNTTGNIRIVFDKETNLNWAKKSNKAVTQYALIF
jgi:multidrug efflux pump subunit AcrB